MTLACERATDEDLAQMQKSLERLDQNPHDRTTDIEFHTLLMNASHNALFSSTMELLDSPSDRAAARLSSRGGIS